MQQDIHVSISEIFRFIRRGLLWALLAALLAGFAVYYINRDRPDEYRASATVLAAQNVADLRTIDVTLVTAPPLDTVAYRAAAQSDPVMNRALATLGSEQPTQSEIHRLRSRTSVRAEESRASSLLHIDVTDTNPQTASDAANAVALALVEWDRRRAVQTIEQGTDSLRLRHQALTEDIRALQVGGAPQDQIEPLLAQRESLERNLRDAEVLLSSASGRLMVMQPAFTPGSPLRTNLIVQVVLASLLAVALVYVILLLRTALDTRLRTVEDIAAVSGLPVLAEFPKLARGARRLPAEASSFLRTNLLFATAEAHPKVLLVSSARSGEGKSSVALSLAESFARNDYRTLLVDADLRDPVIAGEYRLEPRRHPPLRAHLEEPHRELEPAHVAINLTQRLDVIPTFQPVAQPAELLSRGFRDALERWRGEYDVIVIDSAPLLAVADSLTIAPLCTGTVLVASQQSSDRRQVREAAGLLQRLGVRVLGVAATHVTTSGRGFRYGYGYGAPEGEGSARPTPVTSATAMKLGGGSGGGARPANRS